MQNFLQPLKGWMDKNCITDLYQTPSPTSYVSFLDHQQLQAGVSQSYFLTCFYLKNKMVMVG